MLTVPHIKAKFAGMKKAQEFYVMPSDDGGMIAESDYYVCRMDKFGKGFLARKGYWCKNWEFSQEFVNEAMLICPSLGFNSYFDNQVVL